MRRQLLTGAVLALALAACGGDDDSTSDDTTAGTDDEISSPTTAAEPPSSEQVATEPPATEPASTEPPDSEPPSSEPPATEPPAAAPALIPLDPIGDGPYGVGVQTITVTDTDRERPLTVDVWFPLTEGTTGPAHQYTLIPGNYYESPRAVTADPTAISGDGPFPLVVYSHGSGGVRFIHSDYTETIASHGYVVAAPDHTGNTALERITETSDDFEVIELDRPNDVAELIDAFTDPADPETAAFSSSIDTDSIAVTGHSFGGFTTYAMASGFENGLGSFEADPRVDAIIPLAPATGDGETDRLLSDEELARITVPALVMVGTNDQTTPADPNVTRPWEISASDPHYRADLVDAQHQTFTDICAYQDFLAQLPDAQPVIVETIDAFAEEGCGPGDMPAERAQELTNTLAVTFLESVFRDAEMFLPDTTEIPDDLVYDAK